MASPSTAIRSSPESDEALSAAAAQAAGATRLHGTLSPDDEYDEEEIARAKRQRRVDLSSEGPLDDDAAQGQDEDIQQEVNLYAQSPSASTLADGGTAAPAALQNAAAAAADGTALSSFVQDYGRNQMMQNNGMNNGNSNPNNPTQLFMAQLELQRLQQQQQQQPQQQQLQLLPATNNNHNGNNAGVNMQQLLMNAHMLQQQQQQLNLLAALGRQTQQNGQAPNAQQQMYNNFALQQMLQQQQQQQPNPFGNLMALAAQQQQRNGGGGLGNFGQNNALLGAGRMHMGIPGLPQQISGIGAPHLISTNSMGSASHSLAHYTTNTSSGSSSLPSTLAQPDDNLKLSSQQVFLRHQIEAFRACEDDILTHTRGRNKPVAIGQIGIRCRYCSHLQVARRQKGSTYFPASLNGLYQAAQNMNTSHMSSGICTEMPLAVKQEFLRLNTTKEQASAAGRPYWANAAATLGLVDTEDGIRHVDDVRAKMAAMGVGTNGGDGLIANKQEHL